MNENSGNQIVVPLEIIPIQTEVLTKEKYTYKKASELSGNRYEDLSSNEDSNGVYIDLSGTNSVVFSVNGTDISFTRISDVSYTIEYDSKTLYKTVNDEGSITVGSYVLNYRLGTVIADITRVANTKILRIGFDLSSNEVAPINILKNKDTLHSAVGMFKEPDGKYALDVSGVIKCTGVELEAVSYTHLTLPTILLL